MDDKTLESLNTEFKKAYLFFQQGKFILDDSFKKALFEYLDAHFRDHYSEHDNLFQKFNPFWLEKNHTIKPFQLSDIVFEKIISLVHEWEETNSPNKIHKGTPYYFYGMISILKGEIDKGLLLMHQASNEDGNLGRDRTPSKSFILLDDENPDQFFRPKVIEVVDFLNSLISSYNSTLTNSFSLDELRTKFLLKNEFKEESFFFVYCIYKLDHLLNHINDKVKINKLASYIETNIIFDLCKLTEILLSKIFTTGNFINKIDAFSRDSSISLNLRQTNLRILNRERESNFGNTISALINRTFTHVDYINNPTDIEYDISLVYCLRNFVGHKIQDQIILRDNFNKIIQKIFNTIFFIIDKKYTS